MILECMQLLATSSERRFLIFLQKLETHIEAYKQIGSLIVVFSQSVGNGVISQ